MSFTNPQRIINKQFDAFVAGGNNITKSIAPDMATMQKHIAEQKKYTRDLEQRDQQTGFKLRSSLNELGTTGNRVLDENIQVFWNEQVDNYFKIKNAMQDGTITKQEGNRGLAKIMGLPKFNYGSVDVGGGDGGVARECISKNFNFIDWFELDPEVVEVCNKHLGDIGKKATEKNSVKCVWGDAFESIKSVEDDTYDHIFVDLNDDQFCIDLAAKNMDSMIRILKPKGVITAQVGSQDKKPKQVDSWLNVFNHHFGNTKLSRVYIPSFDCSWNFSSSINH